MQHVDDVTSGPLNFSGPIGKDLQNCASQPVVTFQLLDHELLVMESQLSTDQQYLYDIRKAVAFGVCNINWHPESRER
mgnify:CR=1 FL=1